MLLGLASGTTVDGVWEEELDECCVNLKRLHFLQAFGSGQSLAICFIAFSFSIPRHFTILLTWNVLFKLIRTFPPV